MTAGCRLCGQPLGYRYDLRTLLGARAFYQDRLCRQCATHFQRIDQQAICQQCGRALLHGQQCRDCERRRATGLVAPPNRALFQYNQGMHDYFRQYKRYGDYQLRDVFAGSLRQYQRQSGPAELYVPIPTSPAHYAERQFDPVVGLFDALWPLTTDVLLCHDNSWHQSQLSRRQRLKAPQNFFCPQPAPPEWVLKEILLLDDIYTTGTTLCRGLSALRAAGYRGKIRSFTLAR